MLGLRYKVTVRGKQQGTKEAVAYFVHYNLDSRVHCVEILCTGNIFSILILILLFTLNKVQQCPCSYLAS
jgi:hypothetical protein